MQVKYAIVWMEFRTAKIFLFDGPTIEDSYVEVVRDRLQTHVYGDEKARSLGANDFFGEVVRSLQVAGKWFILGSRSGCFGLLGYICRHRLESRVVDTKVIEVHENMGVLSHVRDYFVSHAAEKRKDPPGSSLRR
ncbi:hypothetical protein ACVDG5_025075 [Mesorhizobium sp. ORM6]